MTELERRFRIIRSLGTGAGGETFEAEDVRDGAKVAVKRLVLASTSDWKKVDLFEREARVLASLQHPSIPRYRESFVVETPQGPVSYLVHDFAPGQSLRGWIESGWHADEAEIVRIGSFLLDVLAYLHALHPPVIHRDVKPANVIRSDDGRLWLVDFGAVRDTATTMAGSSTVVGTYGYMAPEQFRGHAVPGSDIYGVGATLLYLLGGKPPTDYPQQKLKIAFREQVKVSPFLARWIEKALEPAPEERFADAREALAALRGERRVAAPAKQDVGSRKRIAVLAALLGVIVIGAGSVMGLDLYRSRTAKKIQTAANAKLPVARLPERPPGPNAGGRIARFEGQHTQYVTSLAISPDDKVIASGSDAVFKLWDLATRKELRSIGAHGGRIQGVHFFSDNKRLLTGGGQTLKTWEYATGKELRSIDVGHVLIKMAVSRDEKLGFTGGDDGVIHVWDLAEGSQSATYSFGSPIRAMGMSPDGTRLAVGGKDGSAKIFGVPDGKTTAAWQPHTQSIDEIVFSPDGGTVASCGDDHRVALTATATNGVTRLVTDFTTGDEAWGLAWSPDGKIIAALGKDTTLSFFSVGARYRLQKDNLGAFGNNAEFTRNGRQLVISAGSGLGVWRMYGRGFNTPFPEPRAAAAEEREEKPRDEDHRRYLEYRRAADVWPRVSDAELAAKVKEMQEANPKSPLGWVANAHLDLTRGYVSGQSYDPASIELAREHLAHAESLGPKPVEWWTMKAWVEVISKDDTAAREAIREAYALAPRNENAVLLEAGIDRREGKLERVAESVANLVRSTKRKRILISAYENLAGVYGELGDIDAAEHAHQKLLELEPKNAWAHENYGYFLLDVGEAEKGLEEATKALSLMKYGHVRTTLAYAHRALGDRALWEHERLDEALREYNEAISLDRESLWGYYGRAATYRAYAYDGKGADYIAKARADLTKAKSLFPGPWPQVDNGFKELDLIEARTKR